MNPNVCLLACKMTCLNIHQSIEATTFICKATSSNSSPQLEKGPEKQPSRPKCNLMVSLRPESRVHVHSQTLPQLAGPTLTRRSSTRHRTLDKTLSLLAMLNLVLLHQMRMSKLAFNMQCNSTSHSNLEPVYSTTCFNRVCPPPPPMHIISDC